MCVSSVPSEARRGCHIPWSRGGGGGQEVIESCELLHVGARN